MTLAFTAPNARLSEIVTRYELPPEGITLLGYIVRRMHKTELLLPVQELIAGGRSLEALKKIGLYAVRASASFGPAYYQPNFNHAGDVITEADPYTGATVIAKLESRSPQYRISYRVVLPNGDRFEGVEEITGTTVGLRGLGMPAPSRFTFTSGAYIAELVGVITSELAPHFFQWKIRAYGSLVARDNQGQTLQIQLERDGSIKIE